MNISQKALGPHILWFIGRFFQWSLNRGAIVNLHLYSRNYVMYQMVVHLTL